MNPALRYALCAVALFESRHRPPVFKRYRSLKAPTAVAHYSNTVATARRFCRLAREAGFRGATKIQAARFAIESAGGRVINGGPRQ